MVLYICKLVDANSKCGTAVWQCGCRADILILPCLVRRELNLHWFHITIFPVTAVNSLKIRQYSLRNLLCYRKNCLCETASTCSAEFSQRISVRKGAVGLTPVKTDKAEGFVKIQSTGNASSTLS